MLQSLSSLGFELKAGVCSRLTLCESWRKRVNSRGILAGEPRTKNRRNLDGACCLCSLQRNNRWPLIVWVTLIQKNRRSWTTSFGRRSLTASTEIEVPSYPLCDFVVCVHNGLTPSDVSVIGVKLPSVISRMVVVFLGWFFSINSSGSGFWHYPKRTKQRATQVHERIEWASPAIGEVRNSGFCGVR